MNPPTETPFFLFGGLIQILRQRADDCDCSQVHRLCIFVSGSLIMVIIPCFTLIRLSCLHFGQYKGKLNNSVSSLIFVRVLPLHIGHNTHDCFSTATPPFILTEHKIHISAMKFSRKHIVQLSVSYSPLTNRMLMFQYSSKNLTHHVLYVQPQI